MTMMPMVLCTLQFYFSALVSLQCCMHAGQVIIENKLRVFIDMNQLAATLNASPFTLIGPDACYAGVCVQAEICVPKLAVF